MVNFAGYKKEEMTAMFTLVITVWLTVNPATGSHIVYAGPMPWSVCSDMAEKLNIPMLFQHENTMQASCVPYQPHTDR
jgi:hypothetical protein